MLNKIWPFFIIISFIFSIITNNIENFNNFYGNILSKLSNFVVFRRL